MLCDRVLGVLRDEGAEGDAFIERRRTLRLHVREGKIDEVTRAEVRGLAIRAMREGKLGFVHTSKLDPDGVAEAAKKACELARSASARDDLTLADPAGLGDGQDEGLSLGIFDPEVETRSVDEKQAWIRQVEDAARKFDPKIQRTEGASWNEDLRSVWLANTKGLFRHFRKSGIEVDVQVIAQDQGEMQPGEMSSEHTAWAGLPDPSEFGRRAAERGVRLLGGRPAETGTYPVVFSPDAGFAFLVYLSVALNGDHLSKKRSWLASRYGGSEPVRLGSELVTVRDEGRLRGGIATVPFDGEGVDTADRILVENGVVRGSLCDLASAKRLSVAPTGNAGRGGYEQNPQIVNHNFSLAAGASTIEQLLAPIEKGLWVWGFSGWWIGLEPSNPNFSSAANGLWIEKGKPVRPVARVTVAGPLEAILSNIEAMGSDLVWDHQTKTPSFRVKEMSVSGS